MQVINAIFPPLSLHSLSIYLSSYLYFSLSLLPYLPFLCFPLSRSNFLPIYFRLNPFPRGLKLVSQVIYVLWVLVCKYFVRHLVIIETCSLNPTMNDNVGRSCAVTAAATSPTLTPLGLISTRPRKVVRPKRTTSIKF